MSSLSMLLLLLPTLMEIAAAVRTKGSLRLYFIAQIASTIATRSAEQVLGGRSSDAYRVIYGITTLVIILVSLKIVWDAGVRWSLLTTAFFASGGFLYTWNHAKDADFWMILIEGCLLLFVGAALGTKAPFSRDKRLITLSLLWILMGWYDFHWLVEPRILILDLLAPTYLVCVACLYCILHSGPILKENTLS